MSTDVIAGTAAGVTPAGLILTEPARIGARPGALEALGCGPISFQGGKIGIRTGLCGHSGPRRATISLPNGAPQDDPVEPVQGVAPGGLWGRSTPDVSSGVGGDRPGQRFVDLSEAEKLLLAGPAIRTERNRQPGHETSQPPHVLVTPPRPASSSNATVTNFNPQPQTPAPLRTSALTRCPPSSGIGVRHSGTAVRHRRNTHLCARPAFFGPRNAFGTHLQHRVDRQADYLDHFVDRQLGSLYELKHRKQELSLPLQKPHDCLPVPSDPLPRTFFPSWWLRLGVRLPDPTWIGCPGATTLFFPSGNLQLRSGQLLCARLNLSWCGHCVLAFGVSTCTDFRAGLGLASGG